MYRKIVVLLDGSELAEVVLGYAQEVAGRLHLDVELLHVCSPQEVGQLPMRRAYMERMAEELCRKAEDIRARYGNDELGQCILARGNVVVGYPAEEILKYVDENNIDLVMMSTHGSSGLKAWNLGAVAHKVVHASKVPVWLVPAELREEVLVDAIPKRSMLVPLSGSEQSAVAVTHAINIFAQRGAESELVLLHVVDTPYITLKGALQEDLDDHRAEMKVYLEDLAQPLRESGLDVRTELLSGDPARTIIEYLKDHPTQLLVMATRGKSSLSRMIFGSVTESVIHMVKVTPLLLISGNER